MPLMLTPLAASAEVILERLPGRLCPQTVICFAAIDTSCAAQIPGGEALILPDCRGFLAEFHRPLHAGQSRKRFVRACCFRYHSASMGCVQGWREHRPSTGLPIAEPLGFPTMKLWARRLCRILGISNVLMGLIC